MNNILNDARNIIYNSQISKYCSEEELNKSFSKIYVFEDRKIFQKAYGSNISNDDVLEGFNRSNGSYLGPKATSHTVIHEVLHALSSKFDDQGHRIKNGIQGDQNYNFANQINEGATDYIASKLSGERPRHYIQGHKLFSRLEPLMIKASNNPNILIETYLNNDVEYMKSFFDRYGKKGDFENLYENFLYMDDTKMNQMLDNVEKNLNRVKTFSNIINKIKNIFTKKETKFLPEGKSNETTNIKELPNNMAQYEVDISKLNLQYQNNENSKTIQLDKDRYDGR